MDIFIRRLPKSTTRLDLIQFAAEALEPHWHLLEFSPIGRLRGCEIIRIADELQDNVEYHGIIHVEPQKAGLAVIDRLNGTFLNNKKVDVRQFHQRSAQHDRRRHQPQPLPVEISEQRKRDRRRPQLVFNNLHAGATA